jgi:VWFA-related protein
MHLIRTSLALLAVLLPALGQQVGRNAETSSQGATFQTGTQLVIETVSVKDKDGRPVAGLTAKDFVVTEDGAPQTIKFFEYQKLPEPTGFAERTTAPQPAVGPIARLPKDQITPEKPGDLHYRDRRLLALYFDLSAMPIADQLRAFDAAGKFIRTQMTTGDLVAILQYNGATVQVLQDFTADRDRLLSIVQRLIVGENQNLDTFSEADTGAVFGQDDSEFNIFNTDRQLSALQTAARMLGQLSEKKALLYFASGLRLNGIDNQAQLHATLNAAIRAGVSLWPIDSRGLVASAPLGDATRGSPGGIGMYNGASAMAMMSNYQRSQDTLWAMAADTGGKAFLDYNDLTRAMVQAQQSFSSYYVIGYYSGNANLDGKFRRVKISLNNGLTADLDYRQGYFAGKQFGKFTSAEKERQLEDALMLDDPITELTIAMEIDYFQLNNAEYFVPLMVKIPGRELALAKKGGAERTLLDFIGEVKDEFGTTVSNVRDKVEIKLDSSTAAELATRPIQYDTGFTLFPGKYRIKFLARDAETGRIGTYETAFVIPNLNKEDGHIPISSVVLSSQRVPLNDAIYSVKDRNQAPAANPLVQEGQKLIPSVTRVFRSEQDMFVYLQAYRQGAESAQPLVAYLTFYRGQAKAYETEPIQVAEALDNKLKTVPLKFAVSLAKFTPGGYTCQVTVLNPTAQKATFWQAPIVVLPRQ